MAAACARMLKVERIFMVDRHAERLAFAARSYGAEPLNFRVVEDPARALIEATQQRGVDASIDAVGFEAKGAWLETLPSSLRLAGGSGRVLRQAIAATRRGGVVSVPGVYAAFLHAFPLGDAFEKGLQFRMGQTHVQRHMPELLERIGRGELQPELIVSHQMRLEDAALAYEFFDRCPNDCRKVILRPGPGLGLA